MSNINQGNTNNNVLQGCLTELKKHCPKDIRDMLLENPDRSSQWTFTGANISADFSRTYLNDATLKHLLAYSKAQNLHEKIQTLVTGEKVNTTENRAAMHTALRSHINNRENNYETLANETFNKVCTIANRFNSGEWLGVTGQPIQDVVNIGIGGSDLGPRLVCASLESWNQKDTPSTKVHFVANIDPDELSSVLQHCNPESTAFIIASKSFSTAETLENARAARLWLKNSLSTDTLGQHLLAATAKPERAIEFGVEADNIFPLWDWVGGRYSLWSAIGLPIAIAHGSEKFTELLEGAHAMDQHFTESPHHQNLPVLLALLEMLYVNVCGAGSVAILPYSHRLRLLPDYLQQLCMESNGKCVTHNGSAIEVNTSPVIWGSAGTVGQHSFYQLLHQGTELIPVDFILPLRNSNNETPDSSDTRHLQLVANCLAQSKALTEGKSESLAHEELIKTSVSKDQASHLAKHKALPGNRPNTLITMTELNASTLGALIAMYEHKVFVESALWDINAFDQWGVELGKQFSGPISHALENETNRNQDLDNVTALWVNKYHEADKK